MTADQVVQLMIDLGPAILSVFGVILASMAGLARFVWNVHSEQMESLSTAIRDLTKGINIVESDHRKIWESIQGLRAEIHFANKGTEEARAGLLKVEGALDNHRATLYQHIEKLGIIDGKLSKLFNFVDAPRRASDAS